MDRQYIALESVGAAGRVGLIALSTDLSSEKELRQFFPDDVELFTNRVLNANPLTLPNLRDTACDISRAAAGILPGTHVDAMIYACTSGAIAIGVDKIEELVQQSRPGIPVTNPASAALAAFEHLDAKRISVLTPYTAPVNAELMRFFNDHGIDVINSRGLDFDDDIEITGIPAQALIDSAIETCDADADLLFISCTALRTAAVIESAEKLTGKPVVTSNQAQVWHCLKLIGYAQHFSGIGSLL